MSKFIEKVRQDTPRMVVLFKDDGPGQEKFSWGIVGNMPAVTLIGAIHRVQCELFTVPGEECPDPALVVTWDEPTNTMDWYVHSSIPVEPLVGMLEIIKLILVNTKMGQQVASAVLGPDGRPASGGILRPRG